MIFRAFKFTLFLAFNILLIWSRLFCGWTLYFAWIIRPEVQKHNRKLELTGMNICMFLHVGFLMESFSTVWTRERSCIGVNKKMCRKCWRSFELFFTNMTFINLKINIIMILLVNLAKIRKSKLAKRNWWFWIWQKSCQFWKCSNMSILR